MQIFENFTSNSHANLIENFMLSNPSFFWEFTKQTSYFDSETSHNVSFLNVKDTPQFVHNFFDGHAPPSPFYFLISPLIVLLEKAINENINDRILRVKANLLIKNNDCKGFYHPPHVDYKDLKTKTFLYYVNDSDGETIIFNEENGFKGRTLTESKRSFPKKNKGILFDSWKLHSSSSPIVSDYRCVINIVYKM